MLLNNSDTAPNTTDFIKDVSEANFMAEVIEASMQAPVIVDFWAPWCGPCKTLGPQLEAEVARHKGRVRMVKVNVDENQMIAAQLRVQSIPTVYAFFQGQPVDAFQGAVPQSQLRQFVDKLAEMGGDDGGIESALEAAEVMLAEGETDDAIATFAGIISEFPENAAAHGGLVRTYLAADNLTAADAALTQVPEAIRHSAPIENARAQLRLKEQASHSGPLPDLEAKVKASPQDQAARFEYALALHAAGQVERAIDLLLESFQKDREWNDGAVKEQLITIFDSLAANDPLAQKGRRRLSSMIFA